MGSVSYADKNAVYLVPLGGLGEIGMNLMVLVYKKKGILIDCGLMFPETSSLGVDIIVPDIQFFKENSIKIEGIILTHGHEDHIGAVPYLIEDLKFPPVYGTPFTLALIEERLRERGVRSKTQLVTVKTPAEFTVGSFKIKSLQVTHSVVDSMGLIIETPIGSIVHSGDFKMDTDPLDGKRIDEKALIKAGEKGVLLLMSDSTNVERPGWCKSEHEVATGILEVFEKIKTGKIVVGVFASNIHRIQQIVNCAKQVGRKVALTGRSILTNVEIATRLGHLKLPKNNLISISDIESYNSSEVVVVATGTQAEARSALYRMSLNDHPEVRLLPGDTVVLSSRFIPGNEKNISHLINNLYRRGANVIDADTANVHASGHAHQEEQKQLIRWCRPKYFLPVHGEYRMLVKHMQLAESVLPKVQGLVIENGDIVELKKDSIKRVGRAPCGKISLDEGAISLHEDLLRDRRQMANTGLVVVSLLLNKDEGKILDGPHFDIRGVGEVNIDNLQSTVLKHLSQLSREARADDVEVEEEMRLITRRYFRKERGVKPVVIPLIYAV